MNEQYLFNVRPDRRQLEWQHMEMYAFLHYGMNTMTDREWGLGHKDPALFNPIGFEPDQWMEVLAEAGMTGVILTAKHHDGFCLWPSAYTSHSVAASPWRDGNGDVVYEVSESARRHGLKFGVYVSPWDRTEATYGQGEPYNDFYVNQLIELCTQYGSLFTVWLDGACEAGTNGRYQEYDWQRYYDVIRALQPDAVISICGPDVRWCGNEAGSTRPDEWSVVPIEVRQARTTMDLSQKVDGEIPVLSSDIEDLGSREYLADYRGTLTWYPAEVDTSIRPGWFHRASQDDQVRDADELFDVWKRSVGGNANLLLNVPPSARGVIEPSDVEALRGVKAHIDSFRAHWIKNAQITFSSGGENVAAGALQAIGSEGTIWRPSDRDLTPVATLRFDGDGNDARRVAVLFCKKISHRGNVSSGLR